MDKSLTNFKTVFLLKHSALLIWFFLLACGPAHAFNDNLTPAQQQIYDYPHLVNTKPPQTIEYTYSAKTDKISTTSDTAKLTVTEASAQADTARRNVSIEFLSGELNMPLPEFNDYRGNPIIIVMLEHIAQTMGKLSGGGSLYFRNRIRDGLSAENLVVTKKDQMLQGKPLQTRTIILKPFADDPNLKRLPVLQQAELTLTLSDDVLAGVLDISIQSIGEFPQPYQQSLKLNIFE